MELQDLNKHDKNLKSKRNFMFINFKKFVEKDLKFKFFQPWDFKIQKELHLQDFTPKILQKIMEK